MIDLVEFERALTDGLVAVPTEVDVLTVTGADTDSYLQGQVSQNVDRVEVGATAWTLLLQPQGKIDAWMRLHRLAGNEVLLIVDAGFGQDAMARLERFKLRVDVTIGLERRPALALRGPGVRRVDGLGFATEGDDATTDGIVAVDASWGGIDGIDLIALEAAGEGDLPSPPQAVPGEPDQLALVSVLQGRPVMGRELDTSTIPAAAGVVERSVDFTKGCYVGQELVARIDSRGNNTPTNLVRFRGTDRASLDSGAPLLLDGEPVGSVTTVAGSAEGVVGLAYVRRGVELPTIFTVAGADGNELSIKAEPLVVPGGG